MTPEQHILDALKTMEDRGVEPTWEDFEAIASLLQEEEQLTKEEINNDNARVFNAATKR